MEISIFYFLGEIGFQDVRYDRVCTAMGGNIVDMQTAKTNCLREPTCIGVARQRISPGATCGNTIIKMCSKFSLRGLCACTSASCSPSDCARYEQDKVSCAYERRK